MYFCLAARPGCGIAVGLDDRIGRRRVLPNGFGPLALCKIGKFHFGGLSTMRLYIVAEPSVIFSQKLRDPIPFM